MVDAKANGTEIWDEATFVAGCNQAPGNQRSFLAAKGSPAKKVKATKKRSPSPKELDDEENEESDADEKGDGEEDNDTGVGWLYACSKTQWAPFGSDVLLASSSLFRRPRVTNNNNYITFLLTT